MKTVYFVRHGETEGNQKQMYQPWDIRLSEKGRSQAAFVAERFTEIPIQAIITSDMERAVETGGIIAKKTGHTVDKESLFREIIRPSEVRGKHKIDPEVAEIRRFVDVNFITGKKYSDEENFFDLKNRALRAIQYLQERPEEKLLVVTHATFLNMITSAMAFGDEVSARELLGFDRFFYLSNTGITQCVYDTKWHLRIWNDHAHLG